MSFHRHVKTSRVQAGSWKLWPKNAHADTLDLDHLLGGLPFGNSHNFTFTQVMTDFRKQVLERAFDPGDNP